jgi:hypothetical protein
MSTTAISRPNVKLISSPHVDSPEEIAEMMAEAARVDALFQSGAISTLLPAAPDRGAAWLAQAFAEQRLA